MSTVGRVAQDTKTHPRLRILHCRTCGSLEELPWYEGPVEHDDLLEILLSRHETAGVRHLGKLYDIEERVWALPNLRKQIIEQIKGGSTGLEFFYKDYYDTRDTFKDDALLCYDQHLRPKDGCHDWRSDRKKLVAPTKADRKEVGLGMEGAPQRYLCDFCVVRSYYERKSRGE